jgi:hypothetical protein
MTDPSYPTSRTSPRWPQVLAAALLLSGVVVPVLLARAPKSEPELIVDQPAPLRIDRPRVEPLDEAPITVFIDHCVKCHGPAGSLWPGPKKLGERLSDPDLRLVVMTMSSGPGEYALEGRDVDALAAYVRTFSPGRGPMISWTNREGSIIRGEASPGARVRAFGPRGEIPLTRDAHRWSLTLSADEPVTLSAELNGQSTSMVIPFEAWAPAIRP